MRRPLPNLNFLMTFEAAARQLSFKQAAKQLHITPSAVNPNAWMNLSIPYWEGPVRFDGGVGYLEMTGY